MSVSVERVDSGASVKLIEAARIAVSEFDDRCLGESAGWLSEVMIHATPEVKALLVAAPSRAEPLTDDEELLYQYAKSLFRNNEFRRCAFVLTSSATVLKPKAVFLMLYARFMDLKAVQATHADPHGKKSSVSTAGRSSEPQSETMQDIAAAAKQAIEGACANDPYILWLAGVAHREAGCSREATMALVASVHCQPLFWAAWKDLSSLVDRDSTLQHLLASLRQSHPDDAFMMLMFETITKHELHLHDAAQVGYEALLRNFPGCKFLENSLATSLYYKKEIEASRKIFERSVREDPYRLDRMDDYSNVLFVQGDKRALSVLAQHCYAVDPLSPQSNCVVGNYYAMIRKHDKALLHFRRAIAADPSRISAWTLMGHEYLEVKNTHAAVEAYRTAVELDHRDYRAWYGLGQTYELLHMHHYALHYYWRTTATRPYDSRMWSAVAGCLEKENRITEALQCLERAEACEPPTTDVYPSLAKRIGDHHRSLNSAKAVAYYEKYLACEQRKPEDTVAVSKYLIEEYLKVAKELLGVPSRSPSFEAQSQGAASGAAFAAAARSVPRPSGENRRNRAHGLIFKCESLLQLIGDMDRAAANSADMTRLRNDLEFTRRYQPE